MPAARLLNTASTHVQPRTMAEEDPSGSRYKLKGESLFSGNGAAIFCGIVVGAILLSGAGWAFSHHQRIRTDELAVPVIVPASTHSISTSHNEIIPHAPMTVQMSAELLRVTAIALGHPRLATINRRAVGEGDLLTIHTPTRNVAVSLRVLKINDGRIDLSDGMQVITARLSVPVAPTARR